MTNFQWQDDVSGSFQDLPGQTSSSFIPTDDEVDKQVRVVASDGVTTVESDPVTIKPAPTPTGIITFGDFPNGGFSEFEAVLPTGSGIAGPYHKTIQGAPGGGYYGRIYIDSNAHGGGNPNSNSTEFKGFPGKTPQILPGQEWWMAISARVTSAFTNSLDGNYAGVDIHQSSNYGVTGPAPINGASVDSGFWRWLVRGNNTRGLKGEGFHQTGWGSGRAGEADFSGGNKKVILDEWIHWRFGILFDYQGHGWFELWARWDGLTSWRNVIPRKTGIYTCYNNWNYPTLAIYREGLPAGKTQGYDYAHGAFARDKTSIATWQDAKLGF